MAQFRTDKKIYSTVHDVTRHIVTLAFTGASNGDQCLGSIDWEEIG